MASTATTDPIHVVMLIDAWFPTQNRPGIWGGGQVHVKQLRAQLRKQYGCKIELFYPAHPNLIFRLVWSFVAFFDVIMFSRYKQVDLIHSHGYNSGLSAKIASYFLKIPVVHTVHGSSYLDQNIKSLKGRLEAFLLTKIKYDAQISVSSNFLEHENVNTNIHVIPNGINLTAYSKVQVKKNPHPTLIWVGRNDPVKGVDVLKTAIKKIRHTISDLETNLVTDGRLTGKQLIKAYKRSHVFVLPSLAEGQPITLLEAWAAKLPVVVTNVGENATMVKNGVNGYLVEPGNPTQLANAIIKVLRAKINAPKMGLNGYRLIKENYSWQKVAKSTYQVYQDLLN